VIVLDCTLIVDIDGTLIPILVDFDDLRRRVRSVLGVDESLRPLGESLYKLRVDESLKKQAWRIIEEAELESIKVLNNTDTEENSEAIKRAVSAGFRVVIVTTRSYITARPILEKLGIIDIVDEIVTRDYTPIRADQLRYITGKYRGQFVFIGDTDYDEIAAREVNVNFIRVKNYKELPRAVESSMQICLKSVEYSVDLNTERTIS